MNERAAGEGLVGVDVVFEEGFGGELFGPGVHDGYATVVSLAAIQQA